MSILEKIRATDRMLEVVEELSRHMGMKDVSEFQKRIAGDDDPAGGIVFLEMAETLWTEHREVLQTFYRHYFHHLSRDQQWQVAYITAGSFLDRSARPGQTTRHTLPAISAEITDYY